MVLIITKIKAEVQTNQVIYFLKSQSGNLNHVLSYHIFSKGERIVRFVLTTQLHGSIRNQAPIIMLLVAVPCAKKEQYGTNHY